MQRFLGLTLKQRVIIAVVLQAVITVVIGLFVYLSFRSILAKLDAREAIDDMSMAILEMRREEKNFILYKDLNFLKELASIGEGTRHSLEATRSVMVPILPARERQNYDRLMGLMGQYLSLVNGAIASREAPPPDFGAKLRALGRELTSTSGQLLKQERQSISRTVRNAIFLLIAGFVTIFFIQLVLLKYFFSLVMREFSFIERLIKQVSEGRFQEVAQETDSPQSGIEKAIQAFSDCARQLEKREAEIRQTGKLASLGVLISGVAHELGNPLTNISMMAETYLGVYEMLDDDERKIYMQDVYSQTDRIQRIVKNLLEFSRQMKPEFQEMDIGEILDFVLSLVSNQFMISNVKSHLHIAEGMPPVYVDASQIEQVLVNLFINAVQAMPQGGDLYISAAYDARDDMLVIEVRDTGVGINKENLPHVFDPFFSTKGTKGTGLGLSVSYGIIREHHGDITVDSEEGKGTKFTIKLPPLKKERGPEHAEENYRGG
jgi:two-component system NtrC family sensor kinase